MVVVILTTCIHIAIVSKLKNSNKKIVSYVYPKSIKFANFLP